MSLSKKCGSSLLVLLLLGAAGEAWAAVEFSRTQLLFGDVPVSITIRAPAGRREKAFIAMTEAFETARTIGDEVSEFVPTSDVSRLNLAGLEGAKVGRHLLTILQRARMISDLTDGAFDVTFASRRKEISYRDIEINRRESHVRFRRSSVRIGVSGIAKGYIVDRMAEVLEKKKFRIFLVNAGGDVLARGTWKVGIADPKNRRREPLCILSLHDKAISTSGNYERGRHIIDPRTKSAVSHFSSVTVSAEKSWMADALATAFFVEDVVKIRYQLNRLPGVTMMIVEPDKIEFLGPDQRSLKRTCNKWRQIR